MGGENFPVVDLSAPEEQLLEALGQACQEWGAMYVTNHGVSDGDLQRSFQEAESFFTLPLDKKMDTFLGSSAVRGYQPFGHQRVDPQTQVKQGDQKEGYLVGLEVAAVPGQEPQLLHAPNVWPETESPGFRPAMEAFLESSLALSLRLVGLMERCLAVEANTLLSHFSPGMPILRPLRYSPSPSAPEEGLFGIGAHTDYGALTVVATRGPGLQVKGATGEWRDVQEREGALVVYLGDTVERWTNGRWRAAVHRVVIPEGNAAERLSISLFLKPNGHSSLAPLPGCTSPDNPARWLPTTFAEHLLGALAPTYQEGQEGTLESG